MKNYLLILFVFALSHFSALAQGAKLPLSIPYAPSEEVHAQVRVVNTWMELYNVDKAGVNEAVELLHRLKTAPSAVGIVLPTALHFSLGKKDVSLQQESFNASRRGSTIVYDEACEVLPTPGDKAKLRFANKKEGLTAELSLTVIEHFAFEQVELFGELQDVKRFELATPSDCARIFESRILFTGTLTVKKSTKQRTTVPVLVQAIFLNF